MVPAASDPAPPPAVRTGTRPPESLAQAIVHEYRRVFRLPFDTLLTVALNAAMMSSAWFFLPPELVNQLFELHGSLAFAFVLSSWMYSDVPATNVLAVDAPQVLAAIDQPVALRRILAARRVVLWSIVAPVCMLISFVTGFHAHDPLVAVYSAVAIGIVPFGVLAVSAWVGILLPYAVVPALSVAFMAPTLLVWGLTSKSGLSKQLPDNDVGLGITLACGIAIAAVYLGQRLSLQFIARRRARLVAYLSDPQRG